MVYEIFTRKRSPAPSSSEPPRKYQSRAPGKGDGDSSHGHWAYESASRRTYYPPKEDYRSERSCAKDEYERRQSTLNASRINSSLETPGRADEEDLEPPGTESTTLQYTLTPRVSFLTWKDRLYQELEELNCLFTIEPSHKRKANITMEDELKYRSLAQAIISMRLDDAHQALVANFDDPLKVMKVLADYREPDLRHLEKRAQQRLNSMVYREAVPVHEFVSAFEAVLGEVEKYSGERISDHMMKQHLLSAIIGDFPNILVGSRAPSNEVRYDDLKKLLFEAVERRTAAKKAELERRRVVSGNALANERRAAGANVANKTVEASNKHPAARNVDVKGQCGAGKVDQQRTASTNAVVFQGSESRIATSEVAEINEGRAISTNAANKNAEASERCPIGLNANANANANAKANEQRPVGTEGVSKKELCPVVLLTKLDGQRSAVKNTGANQPSVAGTNIAGKSVDTNERRTIGTTVASQNPIEMERRVVSKYVIDKRPHAVKDVKANEQRTCGASANSKVDERRSVSINAVNRLAEVNDPRPVSTNADIGEQRTTSQNTEASQWHATSSNVAGKSAGANVSHKNANAAERRVAHKTGASNERYAADAVKSTVLYERRATVAKTELDEQIEEDKRIQELIEINPRLASKEISCTKCGAYGHVVGDCKRKDNRRKCYSCLKFVDHVASTCPERGDYSVLTKILQDRMNVKFVQESRDSKSLLPMKPPPSPPPFMHSRLFEDKPSFSVPPEIPKDVDEKMEEVEEEDDLPLVDGLRQVYHIRRRITTKKLKTGRVARKDLIFTDSDFYTDVEYREMFIEEDEEEPGDIILETIKVMTTNQN